MSRDESSAAAPEMLRLYLSTRDVPCDGCGYNLRGVSHVFCPECGRVIPAPPAEFTIRLRMERADLKLACVGCGYIVTGVNTDRCPECGSLDLERFTGQAPPRSRPRWWSRYMPLPLALLGLLSTCIGVACVLLGAIRQIGSSRGMGSTFTPWQGAMLAAGPIAISVTWLWWRGPISRLEPGERKTLAAVAILTSLAMVIAATGALR